MPKVIIIIILYALINWDINAQWNVEVGYEMNFPQWSAIDNLLAAYMPENTRVQNEFGNLTFTHGLRLGVSYGIDHTRMSLSWGNNTRSLSGLFYRPDTDSFIDRQYDFGLQHWRFGVTQEWNQWGMGTDIVTTRLAIERPIGGNDLSVIHQRAWGLDVHLDYKLHQGDRLAIILRPYYRFALGDYSLDALAQDLNISTFAAVIEENNLWGITILFSNGAQ